MDLIKYETSSTPTTELENLRKTASETRLTRTGWFSSKETLINPELHNVVTKYDADKARLAAETSIEIAKAGAQALVQKTKDIAEAHLRRNQEELRRAALSVQAQLSSSAIAETLAVSGQISRTISDSINKLEADSSLDPTLKSIQAELFRNLGVNTTMNLAELATTITKGGVK